MSGATPPSNPPITKPSALPPQPPAAGVTRTTLLWFGLAIVVVSFFAAFLGSWLARSVDTATPTPTPTATSEEASIEDYEAALEEILPAGSAVRAGSGAPEAGKGHEGDVYIDISSADVYLFEDDWVLVGNIRESAAANLTGATGSTGATGATGATGSAGATGAPGEPGAAGTQITLGVGSPVESTCEGDDIYIDTTSSVLYQCTDGAWLSFGGPPAADEE